MPLRTGERIGAYEITGPLGKGGMGEVYRGRDTKLDREVAVKVLPESLSRDPERLIRFEREAKALAALNHPNIAQIYAVEGTAFIMELVPGETLGERMKRGAIPIEDALSIAAQMASALDAAHEKGIIHRDFKPGNVMVTPDGVVKVLDFGLVGKAPATSNGNASVDPEDSPTLTMAATQAGFIMGTAAYMAPEQASGKPVDKRADIWAFGVVLWEMLTGKRAFEGETISHVLAAVLTKEPDLALIPARVQPLLQRCLEKDPRKRLRDIGDAMGLVAGERAMAGEVGRTASWRARLGWVVAGGVAAALAALAWVHFREKSTSEQSLHVAIQLPKDVGFPGYFSLSPDGRYLASASVIGSERQLWVRDIATGDFRVFPGTAAARSPFWSPDGRFIAFLQEGLKIVPAAGGPAQTVCASGTASTGSWGMSGEILFYDPTERGLRHVKVDADGGNGHVCSPFLTSADGELHMHPRFLPDGKHFAFLIQSQDEQRQGVYIGDIGDPKDIRKILPDLSSVIVAPPVGGGDTAHLLFLRGDNLMAQAFQSSGLRLSGDPFVVVPGAEFGPNGYEVLASAAPNGLLVYGSNTPYTAKSTLTWFDRTGRRLKSEGNSAVHLGIFLSHSGTLVGRPIRPAGVVVRDLVRGTDTVEGANGWQGLFTPDDRQVIFTVQGGRDILSKSLSQGTQRVVYKGAERATASDFSRDGRALFFTVESARTRADIWVLDDPLAGTSPSGKAHALLQTPSNESQAHLSPDGKWIAYTADTTGSDEIYIQAFPMGADRWRVSSAGGREPQWSPDGRELYYMQGNQLMAAPVRTAGAEFIPGQAKELFSFRQSNYLPVTNLSQYAVAPDGKFVVNEKEEVAPTLELLTNWLAAVKK